MLALSAGLVTDDAQGNEANRKGPAGSSRAPQCHPSRSVALYGPVSGTHGIASSGINIPRYRSACAHVIFYDATFTQRQPVEQKLWDVHVRVNYRFKKLMRMVRGGLISVQTSQTKICSTSIATPRQLHRL